jgi:hypothetical protein
MDNGCDVHLSTISWNSEADKTYHIQVTGGGIRWLGKFRLVVTGTEEELIERDFIGKRQ